MCEEAAAQDIQMGQNFLETSLPVPQRIFVGKTRKNMRVTGYWKKSWKQLESLLSSVIWQYRIAQWTFQIIIWSELWLDFTDWHRFLKQSTDKKYDRNNLFIFTLIIIITCHHEKVTWHLSVVISLLLNLISGSISKFQLVESCDNELQVIIDTIWLAEKHSYVCQYLPVLAL